MSDEPTVTEALSDRRAKIFRTTPVGVAVYPHLLEHDQYQLDKNGVYQCNTKLLLDPAAPTVKDFLDDLNSMIDEAFEAGKAQLKKDWEKASGDKKAKIKKTKDELQRHTPFDDEVDEDGEPTGKILLKMKSVVRGKDAKSGKEWQREIPIFDSANGQIKGEDRDSLKLWGGSKIAVAAQVVPYVAEGLKLAGCSLRINAVQVIEVAGADRSAQQYGFGQHEGYLSESESETEEVVDDSNTEDEEF